jgi:adenylate cyclase
MSRDIFISYSRKDSPEALALAEQLRREGMSVWIDQHGIGGASEWAAEIAKAIRDSSSILLLISEHSVSSDAVQKEVALASSRKKPILPVVLRRTVLPVSLEYHLAGIQRVRYEDTAGILTALRDIAAGGRLQSILDSRPGILALPFEDLSPEQDNGWFSDGLTSELISVLSKIKSIRVIDWKTALVYKGARGHTRDIARELDVRYFLEGNVRKFGEQIKISCELLDIDTGEYLWHYAHRGVFADIFQIQEDVATKVAQGLKLHLTYEEQRRVAARATQNAEAYELFLKASECYFLWTRERMQAAVDLSDKAISLDPDFAEARKMKAMALCNLYRIWDRNAQHLADAEALYSQANKLDPNLPVANQLIMLYIMQGRMSEAERLARQNVNDSREDFYAHFMLGFLFYNTGRMLEAAEAYEGSILMRPDYRMSYWNLCEALDRASERERCTKWAERALPLFQKWSVLHPEDQFAQVQYAFMLMLAAQIEASRNAMRAIIESKNVDGFSLYTIATIYLHLKEDTIAAQMLERAVTAGFSEIELLRNDPHFQRVAHRPEFEAIVERLS